MSGLHQATRRTNGPSRMNVVLKAPSIAVEAEYASMILDGDVPFLDIIL